MTDIIEFPDPEALLVAFLRHQLTQRDLYLPVATRVPQFSDGRPPHRYVRVVLAGGTSRDVVIDESLFSIEVHYGAGEDSVEASRIASLIRGLMAAWPQMDPRIRRVREVGRPVPRAHPDTGAPSYSQSHAIITRGL